MRDIDRYCRDDRSDSETQTVHLKPMAMERDMERSKFSFSLFFIFCLRHLPFLLGIYFFYIFR